MVKSIQSRGVLLALVFPQTYSPEATSFYTSDDEPFQCGIGVFKEGKKIVPHEHSRSPQQISRFQEFLLVRSGRVAVDLYDEAGDWASQVVLNSGDAILQLRGRHGLEFLQDTELLELKQGPHSDEAPTKKAIPTVKTHRPRLDN